MASPRRSPRKKAPVKTTCSARPTQSGPESRKLSIRMLQPPSPSRSHKDLVADSLQDRPVSEEKSYELIGKPKSSLIRGHSHTESVSISENKTQPFPSFHNTMFNMSSTILGSSQNGYDASKKLPPSDRNTSLGGKVRKVSTGRAHAGVIDSNTSKITWFDDLTPIGPLTIQADERPAQKLTRPAFECPKNNVFRHEADEEQPPKATELLKMVSTLRFAQLYLLTA